MIAEIKKRIFEKSPERLFALILVIYWALHPNRPKVIVAPFRNHWLLLWKNYASVLTSPKCLISVPGGPYKLATRYLRVESGDVVLDVGACRGEFIVPVAENVGNKGLVVAIEPEPGNLVALKKAVSGLGNVRIVNKCACNRKEKVKLFLSKYPGEHSLVNLGEKMERTIETQADTLDNICSQLKIKMVDFIKMDIQGTELQALEGAIGILKTVRKIVVETHRVSGKEPTWPKVQKFLKDRGFETYVEDEIVYAWRRLETRV